MRTTSEVTSVALCAPIKCYSAPLSLVPLPHTPLPICSYFLRKTLWLMSGQNSLNAKVIISKPTFVAQR